MLFWGK